MDPLNLAFGVALVQAIVVILTRGYCSPSDCEDVRQKTEQRAHDVYPSVFPMGSV